MSDLEPARNDNGQFAPAEPLTGQAGLEHDAGWRPLVKEQAGEAEIDEQQGAEELAARREDEAEPTPIILQKTEAMARGEVEPFDDPDSEIKTSLTPEWAAESLTTWREGLAEIDQQLADAELLAQVDAEPLDQPAEPNPVQEPQAEQQAADPQAQALQWLEDHPEAHRALSEHVHASTAAAEQARAAYAQQLDGVLAVARQVTFAMVPELRGITDLNHAASVLSAIQQQNPQRFAQLQQLDRETGQIMAAAQNERQAAAQREQQAVRAYNAEQSRAYEQKYGAVDRTAADGVRSYLQGLGATDEDFAALLQSRVPMWAQKALIDATQYHKLMSNPPKPSRQPLPPVQRPGVAQPREAAAEFDLRSLNARLNSSGRPEDAAALVSAMRASRR